MEGPFLNAGLIDSINIIAADVLLDLLVIIRESGGGGNQICGRGLTITQKRF